jgi:Mg2+ and Co2+ transporter CorA
VLQDGSFYKVRELSGLGIEVETRFDKSSELSELLIDEQIRKCKEKIELASEAQDIDDDLNKLFNRTRKLLNLAPSRKDISDSLKQVLSGLSNIVSGLAGMRNKMSDAHAGNYKPSRHHAKLAVNAAKTLADFLFETKNYQKEKGIIGTSVSK